jgi:hypothetical protein
LGTATSTSSFADGVLFTLAIALPLTASMAATAKL